MTDRTGGRIVTFYSYKGGTGRSMALANVAWILASQGCRVLAIDWDLEAPGLHRYFHPFLEDPELTASPGLIDFVCEFAEAARQARRDRASDPAPGPAPGTDPASGPESAPEPGQAEAQARWHEPFLSLLRYTYSLEWDFGDGTLDFVPAGQQGPAYALRVNGFTWQEFYDVLGGGVLLEGLKRRLRDDYDYVLIDSRTGISDTSGVCTVQMPDDLVVCFTLNHQSVKGAAAVAESADLQRRRPSGEPSLRVWPVPTRVELAEKDRLDAARQVAQDTFRRYLGHLSREERAAYWSAAEILYQPYFAYEEVLAVFAERRQQKASLLSSFETLAGHLSRGAVDALGRMSEPQRLAGLERFRRLPVAAAERPSAKAPKVFISFAREDYDATERLARALLSHFGPDVIWWEGDEVLPGDDWDGALGEAFDSAGQILACFGPGWSRRIHRRVFEQQLESALMRQVHIVPVLVEGLDVSEWVHRVRQQLGLERLDRFQAIAVSRERFDDDVERLVTALQRLRARARPPAAALAIDPEDPHKHQWGGRRSDRGRELSASVRAITDDWFEVRVTLARSTGGPPLTHPVTFHLHPTFRPARQTVPPDGESATLSVTAWGAFTVGAETDDGETRLELDLAQDARFPERFRTR